MGCDGEAAGDGRGGGGGRMKIQKQEPHTMMWGKMVFLKPSQTSDCLKGWFERFGFGFLFGQIVDGSCFTKRRRNELYT